MLAHCRDSLNLNKLYQAFGGLEKMADTRLVLYWRGAGAGKQHFLNPRPRTVGAVRGPSF